MVVGVVAPVEEAEFGFLVDHQAEVGREAQLDLLARPGRVDQGTPDRHLQVAGDGVDQFQVEGPLGGEVLVHEGLGDPGCLGDVVHGGGPVAPVGEELQGHGDQLATPLLSGQPTARRLGGGAHASRLPGGQQTLGALVRHIGGD